MRISLGLERCLDPYQKKFAEFLNVDLESPRFLARSIEPHISALSQKFNRTIELEPNYWKSTSNVENLLNAYFLVFMPTNAMRVAAVFSELDRHGFDFGSFKNFRAVEFGSGPGSGFFGAHLAREHGGVNLPEKGIFAMIEKDKASLELGAKWMTSVSPWEIETFHRRLDLKRPWLPRAAPSFDLWISSFFLNEVEIDAQTLADSFLKTAKNHLNPGGLSIFVEPALKNCSRRLLEFRKELLPRLKREGLQILLPCLGSQACGALAAKEDWCHEEITWWRPPYLRKIDEKTSLDHKTLHFSYLVLWKSEKPLSDAFPKLAASFDLSQVDRIVSPCFKQGSNIECYGCGQSGKRRLRLEKKGLSETDILRGDFLLSSETREIKR